MRLNVILIAIAVVAISFFVSLKAMDWLSPRGTVPAPAIAQLPPLPPAPRSSVILAQVVVPIAAIRDAADRGAPRNFTGKADNPVSQILQNADIGWTASRGPIAATGGQDVLSLSTPLTGKLNVTGSLSSKATGAVGDAIGGLLGGNVAKQIGNVNIKAFNASAEIKGNVTISSRPKLAAAWHLEPNLSAQVTLGDTSVSVAGARVNVPAQVKPVIDKTVADQIAAAGAKIRNDPSLERNARIQWAKACRSIPLRGAGAAASMPALWLELRPTRAVAVQPQVDAAAVTLTLGIEAETRITPAQTTPDCPFPEKISIVPPTPAQVSIGIPIDVPFTDINKIVEAQFAGRYIPRGRLGLGQCHGEAGVGRTVGRPTIDLAAGQRQGEDQLVRFRRRSQRLYLGPAGARSDAADPAAHRRRTRRRIRSRVRTIGRGGARGDAASAKSPGRQGQRRSQANPRRSAEQDRRRDRGTREERGWRARDDGNHQPATSPTSPSIPKRCG